MDVLRELRTAGLSPDIITYNTLLNIAAKGAACAGNIHWSTNGLKVSAQVFFSSMQNHLILCIQGVDDDWGSRSRARVCIHV
jgi:hypothetical protein